MGNNVKTIHSSSRLISDQMIDLKDVVQNPLLYGNIITADTAGVDGITFTAGTPKKIYHNLSRKHRGWIVMRDFGTAHSELKEAYPIGCSEEIKNTTLYLVSASNATVYLYVF